MTTAEAVALGIPVSMISGFAHLTPDEAREQKCEDCGEVMQIHTDARWRFQSHVIRCIPCQDKATAKGYSLQEAMFVV